MKLPTPKERRRSPRFGCSGEAKIVGLPSNGLFLPGRVRDLSLGGCCVEIAWALDCGARTEIVVRINSASFRAVSQVRAIRDRAAIGMEFVHLSERGRDILADVVERLAKLQASGLGAARSEVEAEMLLPEIEREGLQGIVLSPHVPVPRAVPCQERGKEGLVNTNPKPLIMEAQTEIVQVDLFI